MRRRKHNSALITSIDIGSSAIRIAAGQATLGMDKKPSVQILGLVEVPSDGVQKGVITSIEETVSALSHGLEDIERLIGVPIEHAWIGISGANMISQESRGVIAIAKTSGEIAQEDAMRALEAARAVAVPLNYEILHVVPKSYNVDGQTGIKDPVGMTGIRLEVTAHMMYGLSSHIKNVTKAVYRTGIDIDDIVLSILAAGEVVTTSKQRELGVAVANIGATTTSLVVYEDGDIIHTAVLPMGADHITNDLAIGLRTSIDIAQRVKEQYGHTDPDAFGKRDELDLGMVGGPQGEMVAMKFVAEIISARIEEIFVRVNAELAAIGKQGRLPAGVLFTGGGAKLSGIVDSAKLVLALPAAIGEPQFMSGVGERTTDPAFSVAVGLVNWGAEQLFESGHGRRVKFSSLNTVVSKLRGVWQSLLP